MKRRFLSTLMALCLALSLIPTAAYATGDEGTDITSTETDVTTPVTDPESTGEETPSEETTGEIMDASALLQAVESAEDATELTLGADITLGNGLAISNNKVITLDLNGKTLDAGANVISVTNGSELTIEDRSNGAAGKIRAQNQIEVESASLVLNSGAIEITGTSGQSYGVFVSEGGSAIVNGGTITSNYAPLGGNNTTGDMNFEVHGGTLTAKNGPAIYMPGQVKLDITGGTLNGGVSLRMGQVTISGGTINAATGSLDEPSGYYNYSGNAWLPDALYVFNGTYTSGNAAYGNSLKLDITGGTFNCANDQGSAVAIYDLGKVEQNSEISISGSAELTTNTDGRSAYAVLSLEDIGVTEPDTGYGVHSGKVSTAITGGQFSTDISAYVAPNYECKDNGNGTYTVREMDSKLVVSGEVISSGGTTAVSGTLQGNFSSNGTTVETPEDNTDIEGSADTNVTNDVTVNLKTSNGQTTATTTTLNVTADTAKSLAEATSLTVQTDVGSVSFDSAALTKMGSRNADVTIQVKENEKGSNLASYTVTAQANGSNLLPESSDDNGTVTITVAKPAVTEGNALEAWYVVDNSGSLVYVEELDTAPVGEDQIAITIEHLSTVVLTDGEPASGLAVANVVDQDTGAVTPYTDLQVALNAAAAGGDTVQLIRDIEVSNKDCSDPNVGIIIVPAGVTLDGDGNTISADVATWKQINGSSTNNHILSVEGSGAQTTIQDLYIVGVNGDDIKSKSGVNAYDGANVVLDDVYIDRCGSVGVQVNGATVEINGGEIKDNNWGGVNVDSTVFQDSLLTVNDAAIWDETSIYVEHNTNSSGQKMEVVVNGGTYQNIAMTDDGSADDTITITGAKVTGVTNQSANGDSTVSIIDSTITGEAPTAADNVIVVGCKDNNDDPINVVPDNTVATWVTEDGTVNSGDLDAAFAALKNVGGTIYLTGDAALTKNPWVTDQITIYGQGNTITADVDGSSGIVYALTVDEEGSLILDDTTLNITGTEKTTEYGIDVYHGGQLILDGSHVNIQDVSRATISSSVSQDAAPGIFTLNNSTFTATNIGGSFSNGGDWTVYNSTVTIDDCVNHGLSVSSLEVIDSQIKISNTGDFAIYGNSVILGDGADVTVDNCGSTFHRTGWDGTEYYSPVQVKDEAGNSFTVEQGAKLTIQNCKEKDTQAANNTIYIPADTTYTNKGNVNATVIAEEPATGSYTVTVMNGTQTMAVETVRSGENYTLPAAPYTMANYTFAWVCNGVSYTAGTTVKDITSDMTFNAQWTYNGSNGNSGSSGGSSDPTYSPKMEVSAGGKVTVNPRTPEAGDKVTITVTPDAGYVVDDVRVTARNGRDIDLTSNGNGTYTFTQPAGQVVIEVTFVRSGESAFFTDVPASFWAYDEIAWAYDNGYVNGTSSTTFSPNSSITRQQVWMILARLSGSNPASMAAAREWAMVNDISDGTNPGNAVTRQQLVALLYRYAQMMGYDNGAREALTSFPDAGTVSGYAQEPMQWSVANGIVGGTSQGTLNPTGTATRAQFAVILYRFWSQVG